MSSGTQAAMSAALLSVSQKNTGSAARALVGFADKDPQSSVAAQTAAADLTDMDALDLDTLRRTVHEQETRDQPPVPRAVVRRVPEATDDFIRNFLLRNGMRRTLETFEQEWYEHGGASAHPAGLTPDPRSAASALSVAPLVPDNYLESAALLNRVHLLEHDLRQHAELTTRLTQQWTQAKKDRDYHRASHNRVVQEKNRLERLLRQAHHEATEVSPALVDLRHRCESLFKAKTLIAMEKEKLEQRVGQLEKKVDELQGLVAAQGEDAGQTSTADASAKRSAVATTRQKAAATKPQAETPFVWPADDRARPSRNRGNGSAAPDVDPTLWTCQESFLAHTQAVTSLALHPTKPAVATCSDDGGWRLSALPQGEALATAAAAHGNWISSVAFHPTGTMVATSSGDKTVRLWGLANNACRATLHGHTDGVWALDFQDTGALLASAGLDQTARVWDVEQGRCRQTLRGHVEAVNAVRWQPCTNVLCTGSGDKTVSLWDARMNVCAHSLYGHSGAVLSLATTTSATGGGGSDGDAFRLVSCDAEGVVTLWDLRTMRPRFSLPTGAAAVAANHVALDASGNYAAVACDDGAVRVVDLVEQSVTELSGANGHEDAVLGVAFDPCTNGFLVSCGADRTVRYWC